ncbi:unnamed protein product [marine sediment metagenome]|uniref:Uncharacterized protein n=1 Tax=marine sediment metagenome TaxID=412755 RepID=X1F299_9ZZZZ
MPSDPWKQILFIGGFEGPRRVGLLLVSACIWPGGFYFQWSYE